MPSAARVIIKLICFLVASLLFVSLLSFGIFMYLNGPPEIPHDTINDSGIRMEGEDVLILEVRAGESALSVGKRLEEAGIIRSHFLWQFISRLEKDYIKSGNYRIELPASQLEIHSILVSGIQILVRVTIPEGVTIRKAALILEETGICNAEDFMNIASAPELLNYYHIPGKTLEGYLYPDTYLFPLSFPPEKVVRTLADTFYDRISEIAPEALTMGYEDLNQKIIIASIVEREYRIPEEASLMAGVFYNRLKIGMALQSCATVEYVITEIQGRPHPEFLYNRDLEIRDPYNTYIRAGLPPGPISSPGEIALRAAFFPVSSDYLYFRLVDTDTGKHYFSRTLDDHIQAGTLYLKGY